MREHPIVFSGPDVLAILDGRKTQTRRTRGLPSANRNWREVRPSDGDPRVWLFRWECATYHIRCPYGAPGDRLWVRETWAYVPATAYRCSSDVQQAADPNDQDMAAIYAAGWERCSPGRWQPSIHMPRWASRITLEVTGVRVERLGEISESDVRAEGVQSVAEFKELWASINSTWEPDLWIWVLQFQRA